MNHAERVKELSQKLAEAHNFYCNADDGEDEAAALKWKHEVEAELHAAIDAMQSALDDANAKVVQLTADYDNACKLVADMHSAAMGAKVGPVRGLVEDVADVAAKLAARDAEVGRARNAGIVEASRMLGGEIARLRETVREYDKRIVALGCLAMDSVHRDSLPKSCGELARAQVVAALPAMREYARRNPVHHFGETPQDPNGVHAWLTRNDRPSAALSEEVKGGE